jgi:hypothetical protein
LEAEGSRLC